MTSASLVSEINLIVKVGLDKVAIGLLSFHYSLDISCHFVTPTIDRRKNVSRQQKRS
jgi:hypothetical protein